MAKLTIKELLDLKGQKQIVCTTAHDYFTACACENAKVDIIVTSGEFIRQYIAGDFSRTKETMVDLLVALEGVRKGAPNAFIYASLPHSLVPISDDVAIRCAMKAMCNGADAIYYSGVSLDRIRKMKEQHIPVIGHVGMIPWHATWYGGCHAVGKTSEEAYQVYKDALDMQEAGCFAIELECVPYEVAKVISERLNILVISMGSGYDCDGQYVFSHDMLGQHFNHYPRHSLKYTNQYEDACNVFNNYVADVTNGNIKEKQKLINMDPNEFRAFMNMF